jgi:hypothetical protein
MQRDMLADCPAEIAGNSRPFFSEIAGQRIRSARKRPGGLQPKPGKNWKLK